MITTICIKSEAITAHAPPVTDIITTTIPVMMIVLAIGTSNAALTNIANPFNHTAASRILEGIIDQVNICSFNLPYLILIPSIGVTTLICLAFSAKNK